MKPMTTLFVNEFHETRLRRGSNNTFLMPSFIANHKEILEDYEIGECVKILSFDNNPRYIGLAEVISVKKTLLGKLTSLEIKGEGRLRISEIARDFQKLATQLKKKVFIDKDLEINVVELKLNTYDLKELNKYEKRKSQRPIT